MSDDEIQDISPQKLAESYVNKAWPIDDDPIDDMMRILSVAAKLGGSSQVNLTNSPTGHYSSLSMHKSLGKAIGDISEHCSFNCSKLSVEFWIEAIDLVLAKRYGGTTLYIKKSDRLEYDHVKGLTPRQIMEKYNISRSYAYKLLGNK